MADLDEELSTTVGENLAALLSAVSGDGVHRVVAERLKPRLARDRSGNRSCPSPSCSSRIIASGCCGLGRPPRGPRKPSPDPAVIHGI
jgi:hypothetical protein